VIGAITAGLFSTPTAPVTNSYESIATVTVSTATNTVTFSSIPSTYKHLQIRGIAKTNSGNFYDSPIIRFNSDTGSNYSYHYLDGYNSGISSAGAASQTSIQIYYIGGGTASTFGAVVYDILDYANVNKYKTLRSLSGIDANTSGGAINFASGSWRNTAAIDTISIATVTNTMQQYSSFALYGIKG
jgi:hypothetical protein